PHNERENARGATVIINMIDKTTEISNPAEKNEEPKRFSFDYSYWSHDDFTKRESDGYLVPASPRYADQLRVFKDLGQGVLDNAWKGYNCSLFAYGQTGSGKSYSMVGYGANKGIIPVACQELFNTINEKKSGGDTTEFEINFSMLEIYNEQVRDLLNPKGPSVQKGGLKIRQHPSKGFYVEELKNVPVTSYKDIENRMEEGTRNRTIAATNMNATSSRAHTIVAITFKQKTKAKGNQSMTRTSTMNLVDLAGSERAESTGATGDRLKEGSAINLSLTILGNVIKGELKSSNYLLYFILLSVPFRDSALTKLLKNALDGNSKTIMIAALSPADINYDETLSTLRFADRAKSIKTKAVVNESPTEKLIRELKEENARLLAQLKGAGTVQEVKIRQNEREMEEMKKSWEQKLKESTKSQEATEENRLRDKRKTTPHLWNLNEDPQLTGVVVHFVDPGENTIGNSKAEPEPNIVLNGLSIQQQHAIIKFKNDVVTIFPGPDLAKTVVNGEPVTGETILHHNDRIVFGSNHIYVLNYPAEFKAAQETGKEFREVTWDLIQKEIAKSSGFDMDTKGKSKEELLLQEDLMKIMQFISEANAMSEELNKKVVFEIVLVSPQARGLKEGRTEIFVRMRNLLNDASWLWDKDKFINRKFLMQEMYQNFLQTGENKVDKEDEDPFWEPSDAYVLVGSVQVYLETLAYMFDMEESLNITDFKGNQNGIMSISAVPCKADGSDLEEDADDIESPEDLIGKALYFNLNINNIRGLPMKYNKKVYCKYKFYLDTKEYRTKVVEGTINPDFKYTERFSFPTVTNQVNKATLPSINTSTKIKVNGRIF
ncbi:uncharacterized protein TRIADDRAFT_23272, partial [Trichoplax adhaerens]